jgi:predicted DNA-binding protein (UPF0251 family)
MIAMDVDDPRLARMTDPDAWAGNYLPPWRWRLSSGELGPEYGPETLHDYLAAWTRYDESFHSGRGLWDETEIPRVKRKRERARAERADAAPVAAYLCRWSHEVPARELEVYALYYQSGLSRAGVARRLGIDERAVYAALKSLRRRVSAILAARVRASRSGRI